MAKSEEQIQANLRAIKRMVDCPRVGTLLWHGGDEIRETFHCAVSVLVGMLRYPKYAKQMNALIEQYLREGN